MPTLTHKNYEIYPEGLRVYLPVFSFLEDYNRVDSCGFRNGCNAVLFGGGLLLLRLLASLWLLAWSTRTHSRRNLLGSSRRTGFDTLDLDLIGLLVVF